MIPTSTHKRQRLKPSEDKMDVRKYYLGVAVVLGALRVLGVPGVLDVPGVLGVPAVLGLLGVLGDPRVRGVPGVPAISLTLSLIELFSSCGDYQGLVFQLFPG